MTAEKASSRTPLNCQIRNRPAATPNTYNVRRANAGSTPLLSDELAIPS
nr:hypothetical protein [Brevundimonas basaltis]